MHASSRSPRQAQANLVSPKKVARNVLIVVSALLVAAGLSAKADSSVLLPPPPGKLYYGVYPGGVDGEEDDITLQDVIAYETSGGRRVTWALRKLLPRR